MEMEQIMACLLVEMKASQEETTAEIGTNQEEMKTNQERVEAKTEVNNNFEVIRGTLVSWMDIHKAGSEANQQEMTPKMDAWIEGMEAYAEKSDANQD
jgi:epoxyqueuosine reductase QueG